MIPTLKTALDAKGYETLTPVQEAVTAAELADADLLVSAQTGSGKTVGFGLAIASTLMGEESTFGPAATPLALIVAPTRELAFQVMQELRWLYAETRATVVACVGGMDMRTERRALERGAHIVVGTPGRLCDHLRREHLDLSAVRAVVLDEADEMLDLGFREDLEFILSSAPAERRTLMFSATVSPVIAKLAAEFQRDAQRINTIGKAEQHADIAYTAVKVGHADAENAIFNMLRYHTGDSAIVFANTRAAVNHLSARLGNRGLSVVTLSGELSQSERSQALKAMRDGRARVCVATDVAARGIDLPNLTLVIHADLPTNTESLLHRSGRTGRAGRKGISALIVPPKMTKRAERLLKWAKINAEWTGAPSVEDIRARDEERLLEDPAWSEEVTAEEAALAAKLLARHGAEAVAAALVRQATRSLAAPEELSAPEAAPKPRAVADFGPSRWVSLAVGRAERAEARWLLPLILRATGLEKTAIGAIRVQEHETYVEVAEAQVDAFLASADAEGVLADNIKLRALEGAPDLTRGPKPAYRAKPASSAPRPERDAREQGDKPFKKKPKTVGTAPAKKAPWAKPKPAKGAKPAGDKPQASGKPAPKSKGAPPRKGAGPRKGGNAVPRRKG